MSSFLLVKSPKLSHISLIIIITILNVRIIFYEKCCDIMIRKFPIVFSQVDRFFVGSIFISKQNYMLVEQTFLITKLFYSFFKTLVGHEVIVELKNDLCVAGKLHSVDQFLNIKLTDISVQNLEKYPYMSYVSETFIRGSVVRYVQLPVNYVDTQLLQDAARKETKVR
ncbi:hypothetical protein ACI65C_004160 [Semiaphis heraclei]